MQQEQWALYKKAVRSSGGIVAAQHVDAAAGGARILAGGGNAVDAAVTTALLLGVSEPWMCGIGGSGYMVVWDAGKKRATVFDFQGVLAQKTTTEDYPLDPLTPENIMGFPGVRDNRNAIGYQSIAVPGAIKGLSEALRQFGTIGLDTALAPAIEAAVQGVPVSWFTTLQIALALNSLQSDKAASATFLPNGVPLQPGSTLKMPALAKTMKALAHDGPDSMYGGSLGELLVSDLASGGSRIGHDDLGGYQSVQFSSLDSIHRGTTLHTAGPASGGPRLIETLQYIENNLASSDCPGPHSWNIYSHALKKAWHSHNIKIGRATEVGGCTSHLSAVDAHGNMAALTFTLLDRFGSGVMLPSTGVLMNNAVSYFDPRPGYSTSMVGGKRINASNMCPIVATRDGQSIFSLGASGANYIVPCTTLITALMLDYGLSLEEAVNHARLDVDSSGIVAVDPALGDNVIDKLQQQHEVQVEPMQVFPKRFACPSGVSRDPETGWVYGVSDPSHPMSGAVAG